MHSDPIRAAFPRPAVSAAVFRDGHVLLVERAKPPLQGVWSLPGGHIEPGEPAIDAAHRELAEETGVTADLKGVADVIDVILKQPDGFLRAHYVLTVFYGLWLAGDPQGASDCASARWVDASALDRFDLTPGADRVIAKARSLLEASGARSATLQEAHDPSG